MEARTWNADEVIRLANGYWGVFALQALAATGLAARLAKGPATANALAASLGLDPKGADMLLVACKGLGLLGGRGDGYALAPGLEQLLDPDSPDSLHNYIMHMHDMAPDWARLPQAVASGRPVAQRGGQHDSPARRHFYGAMAELARMRAPLVAPSLGLRPGMRLLDLGGGPGIYALSFARFQPGLAATVFDLPGAEPHFRREAKSRGLEGKVGYIVGDYNNDDLGGPYDVVWLSQVLHGAGPEVCRKLVGKAAQALAPGGALWVQEFVLDRRNPSPPFAALFALNMLVNTEDGRGYTAEEISQFMIEAGLGQCEYSGPLPPGSPVGLVRGVKP